LLAGQNESLETLLTTYLKARPEDADAWFMRLVKEKSAGDKANPQVIEDARQALSARWSHVADRIAGRDPSAQPQPAAQPAGAAVPPGPGLPAGPGCPGGIRLPGPAAGAAAAGQPAPDPAEAVQRIKSGDGG